MSVIGQGRVPGDRTGYDGRRSAPNGVCDRCPQRAEGTVEVTVDGCRHGLRLCRRHVSMFAAAFGPVIDLADDV